MWRDGLDSRDMQFLAEQTTGRNELIGKRCDLLLLDLVICEVFLVLFPVLTRCGRLSGSRVSIGVGGGQLYMVCGNRIP